MLWYFIEYGQYYLLPEAATEAKIGPLSEKMRIRVSGLLSNSTLPAVRKPFSKRRAIGQSVQFPALVIVFCQQVTWAVTSCECPRG